MPEDKNNKTILVIEDDPLSRRLTVYLLELNGFHALSCEDGNTAVTTLKNIIPDLILLDINMPKMNGFEVYKKIREEARFNHIKVIALSASVMKEDEQRIIAAGFNDFVPKPIDIKGLVSKVKGYLSI